MSRRKEPDLFVYWIALRRSRRGDQDQRGRVIECNDGLSRQRATRIEIVPVAKDGAQLLRDRSRGGFATDQILVNTKALEPSVHPLGHTGVTMAIREKRPILERYRC